MEEELKEYDLKIRESDSPDRLPIDFSIEDDQDNVCWVWGENPYDVEVECDHPHQCIEFDDDETVGECALCGATCDWHYEVDWDSGYKASERTPHGWHRPEKIGGLVGKYLKQLKEK